MAISEDLINFDLIETHKENIIPLPGGRSARQLASILSPLPTARSGASPTLDETKTLNDAIRQEYELELQSIADSDDPLDIYDRYVKWTLNAYPSAQATPQSQLLPLLERATKAFLTSSHYKNDPRYLKLWLHYIRLFSDAPRETFAYLSRHNIGEGLGLFYEEFAAWLESAGRWNQAEEVYKLGIEREARPAERLMRKYTQFQQRREVQPVNVNEPSSPALPTMRPALAAKIDPFASTPRSDDPQAARPRSGPGPAAASRSGKPKMAIFSDAGSATPPVTTSTTNGWDSIGSIKDRKKENTIEARPWTGEVLKAGKKVGTVPKMEIFKDSTLRSNETKSNQNSKQNPIGVVNPRTGRAERVFVNLEAVYPTGSVEYSFEELRARRRGWLDRSWKKEEEEEEEEEDKVASPVQPTSDNARRSPARKADDTVDIENLSEDFHTKASLDEPFGQPSDSSQLMKPARQKRIKVREVRQETQTVKTRLESPTGPKMKRKNNAEPTMTFHSKAATDEIYNIFNQPLKQERKDDTQSGGEEGDTTDFGDDTDYSESTGNGHISGANSEFGDEDTMASKAADTSVSPWSDFTASKHVPEHKDGRGQKSKTKLQHARMESEENLSDVTSSQLNQSTSTQTDLLLDAFDTQAIAAIAAGGPGFDGDMDTKVIAALAAGQQRFGLLESQEQERTEEELKTPVSPAHSQLELEMNQHHNNDDKPRYIPLPPVDYEPTPLRPFRDPEVQAQNRLPFMTPIVEKTESSVAASTVFAAAGEKEYFGAKTPSRRGDLKYESPSGLQVGGLGLGSPASETRKRLVVGANGDGIEFLTASPQKKRFVNLKGEYGSVSEINGNLKAEMEMVGAKIPFGVTKPAPAPAPSTTSTSTLPNTTATADNIFKVPAPPSTISTITTTKPRSTTPVIKDLQCNPCHPTIRAAILASLSPPLSADEGYHDNTPAEAHHYASLANYAARQNGKVKASPRKGSDRTQTKMQPPILRFNGSSRVYAAKKLLGKGAFAPVYLVDSIAAEDAEGDTSRGALEALKTDNPPQNAAWEFHILRTLRSRLLSASTTSEEAGRALQSIVQARECHVFADEAYLVLDFHPQGTLLDLVNLLREDNVMSGAGNKDDEVLAAWVGVELLRTLEAVHSAGILHGDLKGDNCLMRFPVAGEELQGPYELDGSRGWGARGLTLIDFGRGIDTCMFEPKAGFVADWASGRTDCVEMREARPWRGQVDWFGAAGVLHSVLFGKYIDTLPAVSDDGDAALGRKQRFKLREGFKRYWNGELWGAVFGCLVNGGVVLAEEGGEDGVWEQVRAVRAEMENWLVNEAERDGRSLRRGIKRVEGLLARR